MDRNAGHPFCPCQLDLEYLQGAMIRTSEVSYIPNEYEAEKASNSYLLSLAAIIAGVPVPLLNLIATFFFWIGNRKGTWFVRWHSMQAMLSQVPLVIMNSNGFWWTISIIFGDRQISSAYIAYLLTVLIINIAELVATIYTAIMTRKGKHVEWWFYGTLTNLFCKP